MAEDYRDLINAKATKYGIDPVLFGKMVGQESAYKPDAVSPKGARGLGQLMPATAREMGVTDIHDPEQNLEGAAKYMAQQLKASNGDVPLALARYNAGPAAVAKYGGIPPYAETLDYIKRITGTPATAAQGGSGRGKQGTLADVPPVYSNRDVSAAQRIGPSATSPDAALLEERQVGRNKEADRPSLLSMLGEAVASNTDFELVRGFAHTFGAEAYTQDPTFRPDLSVPEAMATRHTYDRLAESRNQQEYDYILNDVKADDARTKVVMDRGGALGLALLLGTELTSASNLIPAVGFAKVAKLAKIVATTRAGEIGMHTAANVAQGTALEVTKQVLNNDYRPADLLIAATMDTAFGAAFGSHAFSQGVALRHEQAVARAAEHAMRNELAKVEAAMTKLGPDATPEALRAEVTRMHTEEALAPIKAATSDLSVDRHIFPKEELAASDTVTPPKELPSGASTWYFKGKTELASWARQFGVGQAHEGEIAARTGNKYTKLRDVEALPPGLHFGEGVDKLPKEVSMALDSANRLVSQFLGGDFRLVMHMDSITDKTGRMLRGDALQLSEKAAIIRVNKDISPEDMLRSTVHEIGHIILNRNLSKLDDDVINGLNSAYKRLTSSYTSNVDNGLEARGMRFSAMNESLRPYIPSDGTPGVGKALEDGYDLSRNEFHAEQFVKYVEEHGALGSDKVNLSTEVRATIKNAIMKVLEFLHLAKRENLGVTDEYRALFDMLGAGKPVELAAADKASVKATSAVNDFLTDPNVLRLGLNSMPVSTANERATAKEVLNLYLRGEAWAVKNPMDAAWVERTKLLGNTALFKDNWASTGLIMLSSPNPVVRMLASELLEDASGVAGKRNSTAAITKYMLERAILGNTKNDVDGAYTLWKRARGFGLKDDIWGGNNHKQFNLEVAAEIESRKGGVKSTTKDGNIKAAADSLEAAYARSADIQRRTGTLGSEALAPDSVGYMPHLMSPKAVTNMENGPRMALHSALVDQYVSLSGWDITFADELATRVIDRARKKATGGAATSFGGVNIDALRETMKSMGMSESEIVSRLKGIERGAAAHTKKRIQLDLNRVYDTPEGPFKLMDVFETDAITLLDHQTQRVSGEAALAKHGIRGKPHLELIREALLHGEDGKVASDTERMAWDQVAAEFMGQPFGTAAPQWLTRLTTANSAARLGGMGFNQFAEFVNGIPHVGFAATAEALFGMNRLHKEIKALARGEKVPNSILHSIELTGGAEFGTDAYKVRMPFDNPDHMLPAYGKDSITAVDRFLRGASHVQAQMSFWRYVNSAQQRGFAEQVTHKIIRYARDGGEDIALRQFGITAEMQASIKADLPNIAKFVDGRLSELDITKMANLAHQEALVQAVHRGVHQIIQGTFIGEQGKWVHNGYLKAAAQFRGYGITATEKQWGRQKNSRGIAGAAGILIGSMAMVLPVYAARVLATSVGKDDPQAYIDKQFTPFNLAKASMNYVAQSGMGGDVMDLAAHTFLPDDIVGDSLGRSGTRQDFVGNYVLPATSLINDGYKVLQNVSDLHTAARLMPGANLPGVAQIVNTLPTGR